MNTIFENHFNKEINFVEKSIEKMPAEIFDSISEVPPIDSPNFIEKIATSIVEVEVAFQMIKLIQDDFNKHAIRENTPGVNSDEYIKLVENVQDIPNLFYTHKLSYWHHLSDEGKVVDARLKHWFPDWGYKDSICRKLTTYFSIINAINLYSLKSEREFIHSVDCQKFLNLINVASPDIFLNMELFDKKGIDVQKYTSLDFEDENISQYVCTPCDRYELYEKTILRRMKKRSNFVENEVKELKKIVKKINKKDKKGNVDKKSISKYEFVIKTSCGEFIINDISLYESFANNYDDIINNLEDIKETVVKNKQQVNLSIKELMESAKELDKCSGENRFASVLSDLEFVNPSTRKTEDIVEFKDVTNFAGMVNTGKTTFMLIVANALAKKGLKTALVLRDNEDVFSQVLQLNKNKNNKAVPLVGSSGKVEHLKKTAKSAVSAQNDGYLSMDFMNSYIHKYGTCTCPLKALIKNDTNSQNENVFNILNNNNRLLCSSIELKGKDSLNGKKVSCPFIYKCDSMRPYSEIHNANIYITNTHSFIQTKLNKYFVQDEPRVSRYIYDTCDLVLKDESDAVQFIMDSLFTNSTVIYNNPQTLSILEKINEYRSMIRGKATDFKKQRKLLNRMDETRIVAEELLDKLHEGRIPSLITSGPMTSKKVYNALAWMLVKEDNYIKGIEQRNRSRKKLDYLDASDDDFKIDEDKYKELVNKFKEIGKLIYGDAKTGFTANKKNYREENPEVFKKYSVFLSYLDSLTVTNNAEIKLKDCVSNILNDSLSNGEPLGNKPTIELIKNDENINRMFSDILGFAMELTKLEGDFIEMMSISSSVKSGIYSITKRDIEEIPAMKRFVKDYHSVLPKCPLGLFFGLTYDKNTKSLQMISWDNVGRYVMYEFDNLWSYLENDLEKGINVGLFSGTSFMPTSPLYHIDIPPKYLMRTKCDKKVNVVQEYLPEKYDNGSFIYNSGINKSDENVANKIYRSLAESLCSKYHGEKTKLTYYLKQYTKPGRERIMVSVGNYMDALRFANYIYECSQACGDTNIKVACLTNEDTEKHMHDYNIPNSCGIRRESIKNIELTEFNIVVVPKKALERGINMVQDDIFFKKDEKTGKKVASFSCILKTNRDYQVPGSHEYAVARVNHELMKALKSVKNNKIKPNYSLSKEVEKLFSKLESTYSEYYKTKYFSGLSDTERAMMIGDLCVEDFQFIGRVIRGDSDAIIINVDASFFRNLSKEGSKDTEKTSTIVAVKWMMEKIKSESKESEFLVNELYGPFLDGLDNLIDKLFN